MFADTKQIFWLLSAAGLIFIFISVFFTCKSFRKKTLIFMVLFSILSFFVIKLLPETQIKFKNHFEPYIHKKILIESKVNDGKSTSRIFIDGQKYKLDSAYHLIIKDSNSGVFNIINFNPEQREAVLDSITKISPDSYYLIVNRHDTFNKPNRIKWQEAGFNKLPDLSPNEVYVAYAYHSFIVEITDTDNLQITFPSEIKLLRSKQEINEQKNDTKRFIAHAGGKINNDTYTNSLEALNSSYLKGFRLFELDIQKTADNIFVATHKWQEWDSVHNFQNNYIPNLQEFMQHKILNKYTPLSINDINKWFELHPDAILITDKINQPVEFASKFIDKNRLMMEVFSFKAIKEANENHINVMPNWDLFLNKSDSEILSLIKQYDIKYLTASRRQIHDYKNIFLKLKKTGVKIYFFHVNRNKYRDEKYVFLNELDYGYGMYADTWDFK
jgi:hypothetical protein